MIKVEIYSECDDKDLENEVNEMLEELDKIRDSKLIDIKYSTTMVDYQDIEIKGTYVNYSAMIIYELRRK